MATWYIEAWWRHQMEEFTALLALCAGNSLVTGEFPSQRPVTRSSDVFFDLRLNKRLIKQLWSGWFETPSRSFWRHCNGFMYSPNYKYNIFGDHPYTHNPRLYLQVCVVLFIPFSVCLLPSPLLSSFLSRNNFLHEMLWKADIHISISLSPFIFPTKPRLSIKCILNYKMQQCVIKWHDRQPFIYNPTEISTSFFTGHKKCRIIIITKIMSWGYL